MPNKPVDKDKLPLNQPRRTPSHPTKSHVVKTKVDGKEKIIRFGEQGASTAGKPKAGESDRMKAKRASFKSRHAKNIAKGPSSAAYWANKTKWAEGGTVESTSGLQDLLDKYALGAVQSTRTVTDALANLTPMGDMSREAARAATLIYPKETELGGEADAMRHMLFQSELSDKYGELPAYMVGLANEYLRGGLQSPAERRMDLDNDMLGRALGRTVSDPDERMRMIMDLIDMGGATTLEESELGYAHGGSVAGFGAAGSVTKEIAEKLAKESAAKVSGTLKEAQEMLGITPEGQATWRASRTGGKRPRVPEVQSAAKRLRLGEISNQEFRAIARQFIPIKPMTAVPEIHTFEDIAMALAKDLTKSPGIVGLNVNIPDGTQIAARYDINAREDYGTFVVALHDGKKKGGDIFGYAPTAVLNNVRFESNAEGAINIGTGETASGKPASKTTIARMYGDWANHPPEEARRAAVSIFESGDPEWTEIGMDPEVGSYFYRKSDDAPLGTAEQVIQIGNKVLAKNVKTIAIDDPAHMIKTPNGPQPYGPGGSVAKAVAKKLEGEGLARAAQQGYADQDFYHATKEDITEFDANRNRTGLGLTFLGTSPEFANQIIEDIAWRRRLSTKDMENKDIQNLKNRITNTDYTQSDFYRDKNYLNKEYNFTDSTIYPLRTNLQNAFDPAQEGDLLRDYLWGTGVDPHGYSLHYDNPIDESFEPRNLTNVEALERGGWRDFEKTEMIDFLKSKGFDSMWLRENYLKPDFKMSEPYSTLAKFDTSKIRSKFAEFDPDKLESRNIGHAYGGEVMGYAEGGLAQLADKYSKDYYQFPFDDHDEHYLKFAGGGDLAKIMRQWLKDHPEKGLADLKTREKAVQHYQAILADPTLANSRLGMYQDGLLYHDYAQRELDILKPEIALNNFVDGALNKYIKRDYGTDWDPLTTLTPDERHVPEGVNNVARQGEPVLRSRNWPPIRFGSEAGTNKIIDGLRSTTRNLIDSPTAGYRFTGLRPDDIYLQNPWLKEKPTDMEFFYDFNPHYGAFPHLIDTLRRTITPDSDLPNELRLNPESLQRMSVLQASKLVGKVNQWDKAQELAARQKLMLNPVKEYESGYKWVQLPNAGEPEGLKSVMGLGCKGGWCTQHENQAKGYSDFSKGYKLYALLDPEGRPHAQASTFEGGPHDWERDKNLTSIQPLSNDFDSQYVSDWMAKDPNYKNQIKGYMQDFSGSDDWIHNGAVEGMDAIDMIPTNDLEKYFKLNHMKYEPLRTSLNYDPANVGGSDAVYLEALRRARQNANQREEKIPAYMTVRQSKNMIQKFMPRIDERERINAQVERLFQKPPVEGYAEGGRAMKDLKDEPAPNLYDLSKRSKTGIDVLDNMLDPYYAMRAGFDAQYLPGEVQWTDDDGNTHSYTAPGIANSAMGLGSMLKYFGGPKTPMSDAAINAYDTGELRATDHYGLPAREDMGFVTKANLILGGMLGQIPLVPLSAANKARQGVQVVRGAMPFIKKALMAIPEYLGPTISPPSVSSYLMGTAGGMAFPPAMEGLMRMYEKYSPELEYEVPDTDVRGMLDDMGGPVDREADERVAQWVAKQRGPSDERARIADNVRRSMMTPGFAGAGSVTKEIAEKLAKEAAEKAAKEAAENLASREAMGVGKSKRRVESTGKYVGAPSHVDTPQALAAMRTRYLQNMDAGIGGRDWYGDASNWIDSVTNNTAASDMAAKTLGITSQGTNVDTNLGFAINAINQRAAGEPIKTGRFPGNQVPLIEQVLDGSTASLGAKRDPYARNLSVKWNPGLAVHPVHDIWQGRAFGYTHPDGSQWDAGFSPQQHAFMDEETQTIIDKANKAGLGGFSDWDALKAQAAAWTGERINSGDLSPTDASKHYGSFSPKYQAFATHEQAPGAGSGHLQDLLGSSYAERLAYQMDPRSSWLDQKGRDRLYSSTGMLVEPSLRMVGAYTPTGGTLEINPGEVARPLVNQAEGSITPRDRQIMDIVESSRAYIDAQNAGAWHKIIPESQAAMGQRSSLSIPMTTNPTPEMMSDLAALAKQYGMFGVDTGNGVSLINDPYSDLGASRTGTTLGKEVKGQMGADLREIIGDIDPKRQKIDTGYLSYQDVLGVPGTGQATQRFLDKLEENTTLMRSIEPELRQKARANMLRDQEISESTGMPVREDIQRARNILSDGGIDALKKALNDGVVLPAAAMAVLSSLFVLPEQGQESEI